MPKITRQQAIIKALEAREYKRSERQPSTKAVCMEGFTPLRAAVYVVGR